DDKGASFYFRLNGKAVFMKGANYIPPDAISRHSTGNNFPELAAQMHMNMLRVWGGGLYADDDFYSTCDENGILVWQDFMFACAMYPGDAHFTANVKEEITEQVKRLRDHACLALWCGNNESDEGWHNWGWQKQYKLSATDSMKLWSDYKKLFHGLIPAITKAESPGTSYWPSSPEIGWGHAESLAQGDSHYWGVWWGKEPFENYTIKTGRFMSEYGFQSLPAFSSLKRCCREAGVNLNSPSVLQHQKNTGGFQTIQAYMNRDFKIPEKFEEYIYVSQLLQARGMGIAIEAHRRSRPYCMGTLFWQLNDCWPSVSWSAIDYYHEPKAAYYYTKRLYQTVLISVQEKNDSLLVFVVSDSLKALNGSVHMELKDFMGKTFWQKTSPLSVGGNSVSSCMVSRKELPVFDTSSAYLQVQYSVNGKSLGEKNCFFVRPKHLQLPKATVSVQKLSADSYELSSDVFAKDVHLCFDKGGILLSDNFFDLEPGTKKTVHLIKSYVEPDNSAPRVIILNNLINLHEK
ncbi:MAG: glycoside hydrolase family 2 protein, partial [Bacteroidia bacterium]